MSTIESQNKQTPLIHHINELLHIATIEISNFLEMHLNQLDEDWWEECVFNRLSFMQQRIVSEKDFTTLKQLDLAALLRIFDQNWYELSQLFCFPREGRTWIKELQTVRNKWAHLSAESIIASDVYRDADTLSRLFDIIDVKPESISAVEETKKQVLAQMVINEGSSPIPIKDANYLSHLEKDNLEVKENGGKKDTEATFFKPGELVALRSNKSIIMPVIEVIPGGEECRYCVFQENKKVIFYESQLLYPVLPKKKDSYINLENLYSYLTSLQLLSPSTTNLYSLRLGRVQFVPYQYRPVLKLIRADRPRLLIADEVGVGKTIEAGLIIKELQARMDISSILIICPKALVAERKWNLEMKRFDEEFTSIDGPLLRHCLHETHLDGEWPDQYKKAIIPFSLFDSELILGRNKTNSQKSEGLLALDPPPKFDLVIVDEAHHIRNSETYLHQGVRFFCDNAQAAIFLTATPVQLGSEDLFTLLNALRPDLILDHASFEQMAEPNRYLTTAVQNCRSAKDDWQLKVRENLDSIAHTKWGRVFLRESFSFQRIYDKLSEGEIENLERINIIRSLEDMYTFSHMINRTRRRDIGDFTIRKPETLTINFTAEQKKLHDDLLDVIARIQGLIHNQPNINFLMTTIRRQAASCIYGLAPLLRDMLNRNMNSLETIEASDNDEDIDLSFISEISTDIENLLKWTEKLDPYDPKVDAFREISVLH